MSKNANTIHNIERKLLEKRIIDTITNCWLWHGALDTNGYGIIKYNYKNEGVTRLSAMLYLNYNLDDKLFQVNHKVECLNRHCWNPEHLYIGTQQDNMLDIQQTDKAIIKPFGAALQKMARTYCPHGHEYTEENIYHGTHGRECKICKIERGKERHRNRAVVKWSKTTWQNS